MTPETNSKTEKKRITVNLEDIDFKVIEALEGVIASSFSSVINQMIREWINQNSERIMKMWGIDLAGIRRQIQAETKGLSIKKELEQLDRQLRDGAISEENYIGMKQDLDRKHHWYKSKHKYKPNT